MLEDELKAIIDNFLRLFYDSDRGIFYTNFNIETRERGSDLTCFHLIELLVEMYRLFGSDEYLEVACAITDGFLKHQSAATGLIPFLHPEGDQQLKRFGIVHGISWLDSQVDFAVAIFKLGCVNGRSKYHDAFNQIVDGILTCHKKPYGYCCSVSVNDGKVLDPFYSTKMTALVLKIFIASDYQDYIFDPDTGIPAVLMDR